MNRTFLAMAVLALPPAGIGGQAKADLIYVANEGASFVEQYSTTGNYTSGGTGTRFVTNNGINTPLGMAVDRAGNVFVANYEPNTIMKYTPGGVGTLFANTALNGPAGMAFDDAGNLYVANTGNSTIAKFNSGGAGTFFANTGSEPLGLAFDRSGNLFVSNGQSNTIQKIAPNGSSSIFASTSLDHPDGLAFDSAGNLYVANNGSFAPFGNTIVKFTPGGVGSAFATTGLFNPTGIAFDSAGNLYAANYTSWTIEKFTPGGVASLFASGNSGLGDPTAMVIYPGNAVPEPSNFILLSLTTAVGFCCWHCRRSGNRRRACSGSGILSGHQ